MPVRRKPLEQTFTIQSDDGEPKATVTFRQLTAGDKIALSDVFATQTQVFGSDDGDDRLRVERSWNNDAYLAERVRLTMVGCTLKWADEDEHIFKFRDTRSGRVLDMDETEFNVAWGLLPVEMAEEIAKYSGKVNPEGK